MDSTDLASCLQPFRKKWVWSVKGLSYNSSALGGETQGPFDRHRLYRETDDLFGPDSQWRAEDLLPWWVVVHTQALHALCAVSAL